jgi:hypothetical protein
MQNAIDPTLVTDIARDVLAELAPQEIPIFPAASRTYFADPPAALKQYRSKDNALGFGVDPLLVSLTPIVLHTLLETFEFLTDIAKKAVEAGLAKEIPEIVKAMFRKFHPSEPAAALVLTSEQTTLIYENILESAKRLRFPPDKARSLADAIIARLAMLKE